MSMSQPLAKPVSQDIHTSFARFARDFCALDFQKLELSPYNRAYLRNNYFTRGGVLGVLENAFSLIKRSLEFQSAPISSLTFMEVGGGTGVLSLLAKALGFGRVIYNDIYDVSAKDARTIAQAFDLVADDYVVGDSPAIKAFMSSHKISADVVVGNEIVEHVYDLDSFISEISSIICPGGFLVMGTHANSRNPFLRRSFSEMHYNSEIRGFEKVEGWKERDSTESYFSLRLAKVRQIAPDLPVTEQMKVAKLTRGMILKDVEQALAQYRKSGKIENDTLSSTNTCDPRTGNWAEKLIPFRTYRSIFEKHGLKFSIQARPYNLETKTSASKHALKKFLNFIIGFQKFFSFWFAPGIILTGRKK